ncbi:tetrathionate respiration response regulator TtrR [Proteus hauseri]|uniref:tetrathionate respiration response regulator TtrR n=1 Tax=Proteus hauseri TaxID=183417 RepID=UPI0032DB08A2
MPTIHLVDDDLAVTDACQFLLESLGHSAHVWNDSEFFINNINLYQPGVVLLDMRMPKPDGRQVHQYLIDKHSTLSVIFLTGHGDIPMAVEEIKKGAIDFLQKPVDSSALLLALDAAFNDTKSRFMAHDIRRRYASLTPREKDIAHYVIQGLMNREIAEVACVSIRTVEVHRAKVMEKMSAKNIAELVTALQGIDIVAPN